MISGCGGSIVDSNIKYLVNVYMNEEMFNGGLCGFLVVQSVIDAVLLYSFEVTTCLTGRRC